MATGTGNLPYSMSPVSPFDVITSQAENEKIANIESLADGTGIGDGAVTLPAINGGTTAGVLTTDASGNVTVDGAWTDWTPTTSNFNTAKATLNFAKYAKIGKTVNFKIQYTLTSNAVGSEPTFSLPVAAAAGSAAYVSIGSSVFNDIGSQTTYGPVLLKNTTSICAYAYNAGSTYLQYATVSATVPHTWANTDIIYMQGTYQAA